MFSPAHTLPPSERSHWWRDSLPGVDVVVDAVVEYPPLTPQGDGALAGAALTLPHQEAAVDAAAEEVLGSVPRYPPVVPASEANNIYQSLSLWSHN